MPPGLSVVMASERALQALKARKTPVPSYYINWNRWLPIMRAYEEGKPMYFATRECLPSSGDWRGEGFFVLSTVE